MATQKDKLRQMQNTLNIGLYEKEPDVTIGKVIIPISLPESLMDMMEIHTFYNPSSLPC